MAERIILGPDIVTPGTPAGLTSSYPWFRPSTVSTAAVITKFRSYNRSTGYIRFGVYSGDGTADGPADEIYQDLASAPHTVPASDQWNDFSPSSPVSISSGYHFVVAQGDGNIVVNGDGDAVTDQVGRPRTGYITTFAQDFLSTYPNDQLYLLSTTRDMLVQATGYIPPSITSIDGDNDITTSQTGVSLVGTDLVDSAGNPTLELCNNSDYASATIKVTQSNIASITDSGFEFDVVQGALSTGTVYAFVTTALGQRNSIGFAVTLSSGVSVPEVTGEMNISSQSISGSIVSVPSVSGDIEITSQNLEGSFYSVPYISGNINISSQNTDGQILSIPVVSGEISVSSQNVDGSFVSIPVVSGDIQISSQSIDGLIDAVSAIPILTGLLNVSSQSAYGQIDSINVISGQMEITGQNTDGSLTSVVTFEGHMNVSGNNISGTFEAIITIPTVTGEMIISIQSMDGSIVSVPSVSGDMELSEYQINGLFVSPGRLVYLLKIIDDDRIFKVEG